MKAAGSTPPASASSPPAANGASRPGPTPAASSPPPGRTCRSPQPPRKPSPERRSLPPAQAFLPAKTRERFASPNADAAVLARAGVNRIHCPEQGKCERLLRTALLDGTLPAVRFFSENVLPLVIAYREADKFRVAKIARAKSPLLTAEALLAANSAQSQLQLVREA